MSNLLFTLLTWLLKAALLWWTFPVVLQRLFPMLVLNGSINGAPDFITCFGLVLIVTYLTPVKVPTKAEDADQKLA